jgi:hypothetical protein
MTFLQNQKSTIVIHQSSINPRRADGGGRGVWSAGEILNSGGLGDWGGVFWGSGVLSQSGDAPGGFHRSPKGWEQRLPGESQGGAILRFAHGHGRTMGRALRSPIGVSWASADMFRRSLILGPVGSHHYPLSTIHYPRSQTLGSIDECRLLILDFGCVSQSRTLPPLVGSGSPRNPFHFRFMNCCESISREPRCHDQKTVHFGTPCPFFGQDQQSTVVRTDGGLVHCHFSQLPGLREVFLRDAAEAGTCGNSGEQRMSQGTTFLL